MSLRLPILFATLILSLAACGDSTESAPTDATETVDGVGKDDSFETNQTTVCDWEYRFISEYSGDI